MSRWRAAGAQEAPARGIVLADLTWLEAEWILTPDAVIVAPTVNYHFYPSFLEYPGSTHLQFETAKNLIVDIVRSLAAYGPKRFYVRTVFLASSVPSHQNPARVFLQPR